MDVTMTLNGEQRTVGVEADEMLLAVLRRLGLRSVRETCGSGYAAPAQFSSTVGRCPAAYCWPRSPTGAPS